MRALIVDHIEAVVAAMRTEEDGPPYFDYGHRSYIVNVVTKKEIDKVLKYKTFPMIALRLEIAEKVVGDIASVNLNIAIFNKTEVNYTSQQRTELSFRAVLYPLYESFMTELRNSGKFMWAGNQLMPEHTKIDRYFWGTPPSPSAEGTKKNIFNSPLDAIELIDLKLNFITNKC
jgi:hypothetical protein